MALIAAKDSLMLLASSAPAIREIAKRKQHLVDIADLHNKIQTMAEIKAQSREPVKVHIPFCNSYQTLALQNTV